VARYAYPPRKRTTTTEYAGTATATEVRLREQSGGLGGALSAQRVVGAAASWRHDPEGKNASWRIVTAVALAAMRIR
jgi:hypothetical protein